jgi:hypothetical protein
LTLASIDVSAVRALSDVTVGQSSIVFELPQANLRLELHRIPLWRGDHVNRRHLWDDFVQYLYLLRLRDSEMQLQTLGVRVLRLPLLCKDQRTTGPGARLMAEHSV